ncbi:MAG: 2-oxo acid dehydrogenase subunit E2 [Planctomycetes bacterium]|nr:2-oxo acid dehydrogenase subunit E2 [Planctomycetota bacterium]
MSYEFRLPDIGEGVHEGEITKWTVEPGAAVARDQAVVEVMTDKATVELTSPVAGKLLERKFELGAVVKVGSILFIVDDGRAEVATNLSGHGGGGQAPTPSPAPAKAAPTPPKPAPAPVAAGPAPTQQIATQPLATQQKPVPAAAALPAVPLGKVLASPATRRAARDANIDILQLTGTGPHGRVTRDDIARAQTPAPVAANGSGAVAAAVSAPAPLSFPPVPAAAMAEDTRVPFRGLRRKIAEAMVRSKRTAAHFTVVEDLDVTELVKIREKARTIGEQYGVKVTYLPFILKALVVALRENPSMNATLDEATQEIVMRGTCNFGIAVDTADGLIVPVVKRAETKSVLQLAKEVSELAERTRQRKVTVDDLQGGTFTITNAGNIGGIFATPVINFPEVAILGVHRIRREPAVVVRDGKEVIEPRSMMMLSVSIDHRIVDGATGARFLMRMKQLLEEPALLSLM